MLVTQPFLLRIKRLQALVIAADSVQRFALGNAMAPGIANLMQVVLYSDHILEIHDTGVRAFD